MRGVVARGSASMLYPEYMPIATQYPSLKEASSAATCDLPVVVA